MKKITMDMVYKVLTECIEDIDLLNTVDDDAKLVAWYISGLNTLVRAIAREVEDDEQGDRA